MGHIGTKTGKLSKCGIHNGILHGIISNSKVTSESLNYVWRVSCAKFNTRKTLFTSSPSQYENFPTGHASRRPMKVEPKFYSIHFDCFLNANLMVISLHHQKHHSRSCRFSYVAESVQANIHAC